MLEGKKVVLAYSGGLDTSVCLKWFEQQGAEPYALYLELGQGEPAVVDRVAPAEHVEDMDSKADYSSRVMGKGTPREGTRAHRQI